MSGCFVSFNYAVKITERTQKRDEDKDHGDEKMKWPESNDPIRLYYALYQM